MDEKWSDELEALTRKMVADGVKGAAPTGSEIHLKHIESRYGHISLSDLTQNRLRLVDKDTGEVQIYRNVDHLLADGWVID